MVFKSNHRPLDIPECNILSFLFPEGKPGPEELWTDAEDDEKGLSAHAALVLVRRVAQGLDNLNIPPGSTVMLVSPNHIYVPILYLAAAGSGRIYTAANPAYNVDELVHGIKTVTPAIILAHPDSMENILKATSQLGVSTSQVFSFADEPVTTLPYGVRDWWTILASEASAESWRWPALEGAASRETIAVINFSSGTTGLPKGVTASHHNIVANAMQVTRARFLDDTPIPHDRWLTFLPYYHAYAQMFTIVITCKLRQRVYVMSNFRFERYLQHIQKYRTTVLQIVPPVVVMLGKRPEVANYDLASVDYVMCAAAPLKSDVQNAVSKRLGATIVQSWGMSETTCTGMMIPGTTKDDTGSVGRLLPDSEAMLVDEDGKEVADPEASGELWVRGPQIMKGYLNNASATSETLTPDGWLKTGDVALQKDGNWWIVDRRKELIKVNGYQVPPAELEALLYQNDDVEDAAVVGIVIDGEELPRAYIVLSGEAKMDQRAAIARIQEFVSRRVVKQKRLRGGISCVDEIPRLLSGKIKRRVVKEWAREDEKKTNYKALAKL